MIRIPEAGRFEFRLPDGAANPYLLQARHCWPPGIRDGHCATSTDPGKRLDIDMYTEGHKAKGAKRLPLNLLDALRAFEKADVLRDGARHGRLADALREAEA